MKFKFDANQDFQINAVNAIVGVFEGQPKRQSVVVNVPALSVSGSLPLQTTYGIYPNELTLSDEEVFANVWKIQEQNKIGNGGTVEEYDFSIEMETGTGKTYVYLRTVFELNKQYGWKKFIVLVPSVAIREGVIKTLQITKDHFAELYDNVPYRFYEYQSKNISQVKRFAESSNLEIMVMTVGAFNKDANVLYAARDQMQGEQPISYIQRSNPVLILDEPQNMEGEATKEALKNFNALARLRYSATHRNPYNLMYQLTPFDAYQLGLVKKIEVYSVTDDDTGISRPSLNLISVESGKALKAKLEAIVKDADGALKRKKLTVKQNDDLAQKTGNDVYAGYIVDELDADAPDLGQIGRIRFRNNVEIRQGEGVANNNEQVMREQIEQTIRRHFEKRNQLRDMGIKVLSLFFIDKVDNYVQSDGFIRSAFIAEFNRLKKDYGADGMDVDTVHKGYFAKRGEEYLERESSIAENQEAYELIMKDKERLLSFDEPTEFIFSHSALKEGWDNPNIFNICTLRETVSVIRKRQEIGRGMRLCVNQDGERIFLRSVNLLSVIANESYTEYVSSLQGEYEEDGIYKSAPLPNNAKRKTTVKLKKDFDKDTDFAGIWERISKKTRYVVQVDSERVIEASAKQIAKLHLAKPKMRVERAGVNIAAEGITANIVGTRAEDLSQTKRTIDPIELIKNETKLTRHTVAEILAKADNTDSFLKNPERFCFEATRIIKAELVKDYVSQIRYEVLPEQYDLKQFEDIPSYKDATHKVNNSIYDAIVYDSDVEKNFAVALDADERVKLFIKMPNWFKVNTPIGGYNPDWAIVTAKRDLQGNEEKERVYFVIETKGDISNLRESEGQKIASAKKHFEVIEVNYKEVENYGQFAEQL
ncbi:MAG: DEAD/DEAH box helicase family protein [bacterium]